MPFKLRIASMFNLICVRRSFATQLCERDPHPVFVQVAGGPMARFDFTKCRRLVPAARQRAGTARVEMGRRACSCQSLSPPGKGHADPIGLKRGEAVRATGGKPPLSAAWAGADARCPFRWPVVRPRRQHASQRLREARRVPCDHPPCIGLGAASEAISSPAAPVFPRADFPPLFGHHGVGQSFTAHGDCGLPLLSR
jgi:hypothetical protein